MDFRLPSSVTVFLVVVTRIQWRTSYFRKFSFSHFFRRINCRWISWYNQTRQTWWHAAQRRTPWEAREIPMGFFLFIAQVRLQALLLNYFPSNHLLMQLAITPATTEMKNVMTSFIRTHPLSVARLEIRVSNGFILSQMKLVLDLLLSNQDAMLKKTEDRKMSFCKLQKSLFHLSFWKSIR